MDKGRKTIMDKPLVSIIIPVYKVEQYLHRCIDSVLLQTLKDIEIILVDDGSPDNCPHICDDYAQKDPRIKVIHKQNGGLSSARNAGIIIASGEYIGFVDSDDYIAPWMYARMLKIAMQYSVDFVMTDYMRVSGEEYYFKSIDLEAGFYDKCRIRHTFYPSLVMGENLDYGHLLSVWHCLYSKKFINRNNLLFEDKVKYSEDNIFSAKVGFYANSIYYLKGEAPYFYCHNPNTISTSYKPDAWDVYLLGNKKLQEFFNNISEYDFSRQIRLHLLYYACNSLNQISQAKMSYRQKHKIIQRIVCSVELTNAFCGLRLPALPLKFYLSIIIMKYRLTWLIALKGQIRANRV